MLTVRDHKHKIFEIRVKDISASLLEEGLGICRLVIKTKKNKELEIAYFTKARLDLFRRFSDYLNEYAVEGKYADIPFEEKKRVPEGRVSTLRWLYRFAGRHRKLLAIGSVFALLSVMIGLIPPYLLKVLIDSVILSPTRPPGMFLELTIVLAVSYFASMIVSILQGYYLNLAGNKIITDMRDKLFSHSIGMPARVIDNMTTGRILSRLLSDAGNTQWLMTYGVTTLVTNSLTILGIGVILFSLYPGLAIYVLLPIPFIVLLVAHYRKRADRAYHKNYRVSADMTSKITDIVPNYIMVKAAANEGNESTKFNEVLEGYYNSQMRIAKMNISYWPAIGFLTALAAVLVWWVGGNLVIAGTLQLGIITAFIAYLSMFYNPITQLGNIIPYVQSSITSGDRLREILETETDSKGSTHAKKPSLSGDITFSGLSFGYEKVEYTLRDISTVMMGRARTAIVGKSGSGKTTLVRLLIRLYEAHTGEIKIGNTKISEIDKDYLHRKIAYVPQEMIFFDDTIAYNVDYYLQSSKPIRIIAACEASGMHSEIMRFPLAYDNYMGFGGSRLSGGQRQRLSIARAMLAEPEIVIFDEFTSNLDVQSAKAVENAIANLTVGKTAIWITHNAREVMSSDYAIVMDRGRIVEEGWPKDLVKKKGKLYNIFKGEQSLGKEDVVTESAKYPGLMDYISAKIAKPNTLKISVAERPSRVNVSCGFGKFKNLIPKLPFPISNPNVVAFVDEGGETKALLEDRASLAAGSAKLLTSAIQLNRFAPKVTGITKINITGDGLEWSLNTSSGKIDIITRRRRDVRALRNVLILMDEYNSPYEVHFKDLDKASLDLLKQTV
jgi:ATP-binding cassette subfamily C protein